MIYVIGIAVLAYIIYFFFFRGDAAVQQGYTAKREQYNRIRENKIKQLTAYGIPERLWCHDCNASGVTPLLDTCETCNGTAINVAGMDLEADYSLRSIVNKYLADMKTS